MTQRQSKPPRAERPTVEQVIEENKIALERAKASKNRRLDEMAWDKIKKESWSVLITP